MHFFIGTTTLSNSTTIGQSQPGPKIERSDLNGTERVILLSYDLNKPTLLARDADDQVKGL